MNCFDKDLFQLFRGTILFIILYTPFNLFSQNITVSGFVREQGSKENLPFVNIYIKDSQSGTNSNAYGFYSLNIPLNQEIVIRFSSVGYKALEQKVFSDKSIVLNIDLAPRNFELEEVVISDEGYFTPIQTTLVKLNSQTIKQFPALLGEKDVIKILQLQPGVKQGVEGSTAMYVRGGGPDQNLLILDDAQVYNANHLFGFLSVFNNDAIKSVEFWKAGFPARYGGRISSVVDIQMKDGSKSEIHGEGGIGLLSSRFTIEGPIKKEKSSFLLSTRRSYLDLITFPFMNASSKTKYRFYDLNAKLNWDYNPRNRFFLSGYLGNDKFRDIQKTERTQSTINTETDLGWGNATATLRWNHLISDQLFINTTLLYSNFKFNLSDQYSRSGSNPRFSNSEYNSGLSDYSLKIDLDFFPSNAHNLKAGLLITHHIYKPSGFTNTDFNDTSNYSQKFKNQEFALYAEDVAKLASNFLVNGGIRICGLLTADKTYLFAEPRINLTWGIYKNLNLTGSFARTNQFVHLLSNTGVGLSTDLWVPVTAIAPPQQADQFSLGASKNFPAVGLLLSVEGYRKYLRNIISYKEGATFLVVSDGASEIDWEDNITVGKGWSYGTEVLLKKEKGRLNGWLGYTLSWTIHQFEELNYGQKFYPKYDARHNISLVGAYKISPKVFISATWVYSTGNALTVPSAFYYGNFATGTETKGVFETNGISIEPINEQIGQVPYFGSRNSYRADPYHRLDIAVQLHKKLKRVERYWEFGLYNAYNRKNPYYYHLTTTNDFSQNRQRLELEKKSLFPILPSVSYNLKF